MAQKVLFHVPVNRSLPTAHDSWFAIDHGPFTVDYLLTTGNPHDAPRHPGNISCKLRRSRAVVLGCEYDWLLNVEDDIVVPPDTLLALAGCGHKITSGLYLLRPETAGTARYAARIPDTDPDRTSDDRSIRQGTDFLYGDVISLLELCFGCILIHRDCLASHEFTDGIDVDFSKAMRQMGTSLYLNTAVRCGHITADGSILEA